MAVAGRGLRAPPTQGARREVGERVAPPLAARSPHRLYDDWRARAACLGQASELFFGATTACAVQMCHHCPVMWPCRHEALEVLNSDQYGVVGGLRASQRVKIRRRWVKVDFTVMRQLRADAYQHSCTLRAQHTDRSMDVAS